MQKVKSIAMEIWKDIDGYEGIYQVSNEGRVRSLEREIEYLVKGKYLAKRIFPSAELKTYMNNSGYLLVDLMKNGRKDKRTIHRLVAEAFVPNDDGKPCVGHNDCNKKNNSASNLYWCTYQENNNHPITKELQSKYRKGKPCPWLHTKEAEEKKKKSMIGHSVSQETKNKISNSKKKPIYQYSKNGELVGKYESSIEASRITKFSQAQISKYAIGKWYNHQRNKWYYGHEYKGYLWFHDHK